MREPTEKQLETLKLYDAGCSMAEIAEIRGVSEGTVKQTMMALRMMLGAERTRHLPAMARLRGWL